MNYKFRAWHKATELMDEVVIIDLYNEEIGVLYANPITQGEDIQRFDFDEIELMQCTGLKDKNGVEIYEGDVLFHPLQGRRKVFYPYSENVASYGLRNIDNGFGSTLQDSHAVWEVIGNIYENPELLKE